MKNSTVVYIEQLLLKEKQKNIERYKSYEFDLRTRYDTDYLGVCMSPSESEKLNELREEVTKLENIYDDFMNSDK